MIHLNRKLGANDFVKLCALEVIADAAMEDLPLVGSCLKTPLHAIHGAADVDEWMKTNKYTCSSRLNCCQVPGGSYTVIHSHAEKVSIVAR